MNEIVAQIQLCSTLCLTWDFLNLVNQYKQKYKYKHFSCIDFTQTEITDLVFSMYTEGLSRSEFYVNMCYLSKSV